MRLNFGSAIVVIVLSNGCGTAIPVAQTSLPSQVNSHLSSYNQRTVMRAALPLSEAIAVTGVSTEITSENVLYVGPGEKYAIDQFRSVWNDLTSRPTVVWVDSTPSSAAETWQADGYVGDPLPSPDTLFATERIPVPDAYHRATGGWTEVPGVLAKSQSTDWVKFFSAQ